MTHSFSSILMRTPLQSVQYAYTFSKQAPTLFHEGVYLASETLWNELQRKETLPANKQEKLHLSFTKYHIRSCCRCTPYGTFAGSRLVHISDHTNIIINDAENHIRKIRIDMNYMTEIINALMKLPPVRDAVKMFPNNSIYEIGDSYRYAQYFVRNNNRYYELISLEQTEYLKAVLHFAERGATIKELSAFLMQIEDVKEEEATEFILSMYDSQLLFSALEPNVTGLEPLDNLIIHLEELNTASHILDQLKSIQQIINKPEKGVAFYQHIEQELEKLNLDIAIPKNTIQTDLVLSVKENYIKKEIIQLIVDQHSDLYALAKDAKNMVLEDFKKKFYNKYEGQEIPLDLALDVELGIGYAGNDQSSTGEDTLINGIAAVTGAPNTNYQFDHIEHFIHSKYHAYLKNKTDVIELEEQELSSLKKFPQSIHLPNSFFLFGSILGNIDDLNPSSITFDLSTCSGPSAGNLLARFTHGDTEILELTKEILREEESENKDIIYAEIAHLPQARVGNILLRPILRNYEIPYVGKSGIVSENQIPISDLMVSLQGNEIILRSIKHNKRVIPRITTAHNYSKMSLPIYRFLGDLQSQNLAQTRFWDWGVLGSLSHLPRVVYKNLIIKKAQWKIDNKSLTDLPKNTEDYLSYFNEFTRKLKIPQTVLYIESDNKLLISFEHIEGIKLFLHYLKKYGTITIEEFLFTNNNCIVKDIHGKSYTNEFIIPLHRKSKTKEKTLYNKTIKNTVKRKFSLNSEWLYFKIYCGPATAEKLLKNEILAFVEQGLKDNLFKKFFFIRYRDDLSHIRLRFFNSDTNKQFEIQKRLAEMLQPYLNSDLVEKIMTDTYVREIERYGENNIEASESLFFNDSLAVLRFINLLEGEEFEKYRMLFALRGIDHLLNDFGLSIAEKKNLLKEIAKTFLQEFGGKSVLEKRINNKYRNYQKEIFSHLDMKFDIENEIEDAVFIFNQRSEMNKQVVKSIFKNIDNNIEKRDDLLRSYIHMFVNRLFINNQRKYELVITQFLERYYSSQFAISQKNSIIQV
ncbi:lantibiotic dehydratase [Pedobacter montanisoli]|uniref:Lantibiotic dehydratase n=1 Tax=Pedobacter montanisoli TaxID=2923277 RepID=A0ABS9ZZT6_9SPHI|nr:lantibiotic dehydratase [Pedobacter montanisoli]MCJ0743817.1 lantibiotic dehydratase [Pedobacter montanisoli]